MFKKSAFSVSDHHKRFTLAHIARESVARELVTPYVRHELCKSDTVQDPSVQDFFKYCLTHVENPMFSFSIHISRSLMPYSPIELVYEVGTPTLLKQHVVQLPSSGQGCTIQCTDSWTHMMLSCLCMPKALRQQMRTTCSFNTSSIPFTGEGGDFKLEELNKAVQHWAPSVPTDDDWRIACSNYSHLTKFREQTFGQMGVQDPKSKRSRTPSDITKQVMAFRTVLGEREYLSDPESKVPHAFLSGKPLDVELVDFCASVTKSSRSSSMGSLITAKTWPRNKPFPLIFVTPDVSAAYEHINKAVAEIHTEIDRHKANIHEIEMQAEFDANYEKLKAKKAKQPEFVDFHDLVKEFLELQVSVEDLPDDLSCD